jgi:hypothetical protein
MAPRVIVVGAGRKYFLDSKQDIEALTLTIHFQSPA